MCEIVFFIACDNVKKAHNLLCKITKNINFLRALQIRWISKTSSMS